MEENNTYTLLEVGENELPLSYLVITDNKSSVFNHKDSGDIVIYTNHNESDIITTNDNESITYTDLYIGDEHIAGGFGFVNTAQRSYVLNSAYNVIPDIQKYIENIQNRFDEDGYSPEINIDPDYRYITVDDNIYELQYKNTYLKLFTDYKEKVTDFSVNVNDTNISNNSCSYISRVCEESTDDNLDINEITFTTKSDNDLSEFWISYVVKSNNDSQALPNDDYLICGSSDNALKFKNNEYFNVIQEEPHRENPNIKLYISGVRLISTDKFKEEINKISKKEDISFILHLRFNVGNEKEIEFLNVHFIDPIYYSVGFKDNANEMNMILWRENEDLEINFVNTDESKSEDLYFLIPESIDVKFIQKSNNVMFDWKIEDIDCLLNYRCYKSPNAYKGALNPITWVLKISE